MDFYIIVIIMIISSIMIIFEGKALFYLKSEVLYLPKVNIGGEKHLLEDKNIENYISIPESYNNQELVVLIASPDCSPCHKEMEHIIERRNSYYFPFFCLVRADEENKFSIERFIKKYGDAARILPVYDNILRNHLHIESYPTVLLINKKRVVKRVGNTISKVMKLVKN